MSIIAVRYAQALFECASEQEKLDEVEQDLVALQNIVSTSKDFNTFLGNPLISLKAATVVFRALYEKLLFCSLTLNFLDLVAHQKRLKNLSDIMKSFRDLLRAQSNRVDVHISSAMPLGTNQLKSLTSLLKSKLKKEIVIHEKRDKEAIGGIVIQIGEYVVDSTIRTQLHKLQKAMRA